MTSNQIDYWKLQETKRHNKADEILGEINAKGNYEKNIAQAKDLDRQPTYKQIDTALKKADQAIKEKEIATKSADNTLSTMGKFLGSAFRAVF